MSLRAEIARQPETLSDLDAACALRWREADVLLNAGEYDGAVYLLGYVVEMRLKLAAFRRHYARPNDLVRTLRRSVGAWMKLNAPAIQDEGGHGVVYWSTFLQLYRPAGLSMNLKLRRRGLRRHVLATVNHGWKVEMRYRNARRGYDDAWRMWTAVWWVEENWMYL